MQIEDVIQHIKKIEDERNELRMRNDRLETALRVARQALEAILEALKKDGVEE